MRVLTLLFRAILFLLFLILAYKNQHHVMVNGLGISWSVPLSVLLLASLLIGALLGITSMVPSWWRSKIKIRDHVRAAEAQLKSDNERASVPQPDVPVTRPPHHGL